MGFSKLGFKVKIKEPNMERDIIMVRGIAWANEGVEEGMKINLQREKGNAYVYCHWNE